MRIDLNARLKTSDGHDAGNIHRVLIDPTTERITGFVVSTRRLLGRDVIVGEDMLGGASADGGTITLTLSKKELDTQPSFEEDDFVIPPAGWSAPNLGYAVPPDSFLWPEDSALPDVGERSRPSIKKGDTVKDRDGDVVGSVEDVRFDEKTGNVLGLTVKAHAGLERLFGGAKVAEISRDEILRITQDEVRLGVDREEIIPREHETGTR
jgi:uncharacterized protein YrrD